MEDDREITILVLLSDGQAYNDMERITATEMMVKWEKNGTKWLNLDSLLDKW